MNTELITVVFSAFIAVLQTIFSFLDDIFDTIQDQPVKPAE